ncbi:MAG TPA: hypothetical protein VKU41_09295 [Polyangiaceae bacterium]|nr:hypothetical protein [Polyangiaceae bacterium]
MADDRERRRILDRANRMLRQSKTLRKVSDELLRESGDLRESVKRLTNKQSRKKQTCEAPARHPRAHPVRINGRPPGDR